MHKKMHSGMLLTLLLIGMLTLALNVQPVRASNDVETTLYIDPPLCFAMQGETFTVDIDVSDVEELHTWQVNLTFNPEVLAFLSVTEGNFLKQAGQETVGVSKLDRVDDGWALFAWSILGKYSVTGSGTLATVEFEVLAVGESEVNIDTESYWWSDKNENGEVDEGELTYITSLIRMIPGPIPPGEKEHEDIPFTAVDGYFISMHALPRTIDKLKTEIEELGSEGEIDNRGIVKSLIAKLNAAQRLVDKGKTVEAKSILEDAFIPHAQNLAGIHITVEAADLLIQSAEYILSHL